MRFIRRIRRGAAVSGLTIAMLATAAPAGAVTDQDDVGQPTNRQPGTGAGSVETTYPATVEYSFTLDEIVDDIGADQLHAAGVTGEGVTIAVIDTGVADVPGLDAPGKVIHGPDLSFEAGVPELYNRDSFGHGTVMASIIAGDDGVHGGFRGVAPGARILSLKVADNTGAVDVSQVIAAIDFVVDTRDDTDARVINLSYQGAGRADVRTDPLIAAVERAWAAGIVVVVSAGNHGDGRTGLGNPAQSPWVIAVAASAEVNGDEANDTIELVASDFSNVGRDRRHPDVTAPGERVLGLMAPGSRLATEHPHAVIEDRYLRGSGTSQAAAVVSGAAALLLQADPSMTPDEVKAALMLGADDIEDRELSMLEASPKVAAAAARVDRAGSKGASLERRQAELDRGLDVRSRKWSGSMIAGIRLDRMTGTGWLDVARAASLDVDGMVQDHRRSDGSGSLEDARGGVFVTLPDGSLLQGDVTFAGASWTGGSWTGGSWTGGSWTGGSWSGGSWTGGSWTGGSWTGDVWEGATWSGATWTGGSWTGGSWTGGSWSADVWEGASWSGGSWTGGSWTGATWTGGSWSGGSWTGATWTGATWTGGTWTNAGWAAIAWG